MDIAINSISKNYQTPHDVVHVFSDLDSVIPSGSFASLIGPSGAGKSTLLHLIGTLDFPSSGSIRLGDVDAQQMSQAEISRFRNHNIGFVFQFHHLLPEFSAVENVMMPMLVKREANAKAESTAKEWLDRVGLSHRLTHKPGELSGGEQQRVALARALANNPKILLADEPTGNLDENTGSSIIDLIEEVHRQHSITTIIVTHNLKLAERASMRLQLNSNGLGMC